MSYSFGTNDFFAGPFTSQYDSEGLSIVCWMKMSAGNWAGTGQGHLIAISENANALSDVLSIRHTNGFADRVSAQTSIDGIDPQEGFADLTLTSQGINYDDIWQVFIATFTSDSLRAIYAQDSTVTASDTATEALGAALDNVKIGSLGAFYPPDGLIAECAIFNKVLSSDEIDLLWTEEETGLSPILIAPDNCIGYWPLIDSLDTQLNEGIDASGDLTRDGATWSSDHPTITTTPGVLNTVEAITGAITDAHPDTPWG